MSVMVLPWWDTQVGYPYIPPCTPWWPYYPRVYGPVCALGCTSLMLVMCFMPAVVLGCILQVREAQNGRNPWVESLSVPPGVKCVKVGMELPLGSFRVYRKN